MVTSLTIKVPATTSNLGPGFDCLGMALDIWNTLRVKRGGSGFEITGQGAGELPTDTSNLLYECYLKVFSEIGKPAPKVRFICDNQIPLGRGLGSSSAASIAGIIAANEIAGRPFDKQGLLELAARIEGHPDNATPAVLGGCRVVVQEAGHLVTAGVPLPEDLNVVLFIPDVPMPTKQARAILPPSVSRQDAVYNIGRVALLVNALATGDLAHLGVATQDALHQPARQAMFHPMKVILRAAMDAGALGAFLSGAGSTILALTRSHEMTIGYEMAEAASKSGVGGEVKITKPTNLGAHVVEAR